MTKYITHKQAIFLNGVVIRKYTPEETIGVKSAELLDSAINRPKASVFGKDAYPNIEEKAAALFESLAQNHPFHNGKKRTTFACLHQFLWINGYTLHVDEKQAEDFTVKMVVEKPGLTYIAAWIKNHSQQRP
ncbi:type II toxin-antitoxin system death-on-curing family toxin [Bacillus canaveralius]|uniref:type II toxin-antitoxin system death-on-curing family toxin n=1 Tax=Bacillus canaveralius TaxID=1403243 RepID=UPI000F793CB0|nr:type II toxin-antitoxin system death-on-curing family toxin [Bacillus canaveralius]RSK54612.1 type II toxin-antitoxin system death-on-curing family toxin [Bacillus canaveralius]